MNGWTNDDKEVVSHLKSLRVLIGNFPNAIQRRRMMSVTFTEHEYAAVKVSPRLTLPSYFHYSIQLFCFNSATLADLSEKWYLSTID